MAVQLGQCTIFESTTNSKAKPCSGVIMIENALIMKALLRG